MGCRAAERGSTCLYESHNAGFGITCHTTCMHGLSSRLDHPGSSDIGICRAPLWPLRPWQACCTLKAAQEKSA